MANTFDTYEQKVSRYKVGFRLATVIKQSASNR